MRAAITCAFVLLLLATAHSSAETPILPGIFDFSAAPGSRIQDHCQVSVFKPPEGTPCVEFPIRDTETIMTEYRSRLVQTGWSEERQLAGDVVISMYRRRDTQSECELSFHPAVFTKFPVNYMALEAKGPTALQEFQSDPQNLNAFIFNVDRYCGKSGQ